MPKISERMMLAFRDELQKTGAGWGTSLRQFGQRQLHALTGWKPKGMEYTQALAHMGLGSHAEALAHNPAAQEALRKAEEWGLTSLPGVAKAIPQHGLAPVLGRAFGAQWHGTGPVMKAVTVGLPAYGLYSASKGRGGIGNSGVDAEGRPISKSEQMGQEVGSLIGGTAGSAVPLVGNLALGEIGNRAGKYIGRGIGKIREMRNPGAGTHPYGTFPRQSTDLTQESGQAAPSETIMTDRASGGAGGGFG